MPGRRWAERRSAVAAAPAARSTVAAAAAAESATASAVAAPAAPSSPVAAAASAVALAALATAAGHGHLHAFVLSGIVVRSFHDDRLARQADLPRFVDVDDLDLQLVAF